MGKFFKKLNEEGGFDNSLEDFLTMEEDEVADLATEVGIKFVYKKRFMKAHRAAKMKKNKGKLASQAKIIEGDDVKDDEKK